MPIGVAFKDTPLHEAIDALNTRHDITGENRLAVHRTAHTIALLPQWAQVVSHANPILYMVNAFRFGFLGVSDVDVRLAYTIMIGASAVLFGACVWLLNKGTGIRD